MKAEPTFSLKDQLFNAEKVAYLAAQFSAAWRDFPTDTFVAAVMAKLPELELKARIIHISVCLQSVLPDNYPDALTIILKALPPELDPARSDDDFGDFIHAPLSEFIAMYGCSAEYLEISLAGLRENTKRFSVEGPIRTFINAFPAETLAFLTECAQSENYHVRRLASEGTRPKLPWAQKLVIDYHAPLSILDALFADQTRYVTRSVANHLNDIAKLDPALVVETLQRWKESGAQDEKEMAWICQHATRTLIKQGDPDALKLLGYGETPEIEISDFETSTPEVVIGEAFLFSFTLTAKKPQKLLVDYQMTFASDRDKQSQKVFKLKQLDVTEGKVTKIKKKHPMKLMTTRRLFPGTHTITLQVNGEPFDSLSFELVAPGS